MPHMVRFAALALIAIAAAESEESTGWKPAPDVQKQASELLSGIDNAEKNSGVESVESLLAAKDAVGTLGKCAGSTACNAADVAGSILTASGALVAAFGGPTGAIAGPLLDICGSLILSIWGKSSSTPTPLNEDQVEAAVTKALDQFSIEEANSDARNNIQQLGILLQTVSGSENMSNPRYYNEILDGQAGEELDTAENLVGDAFKRHIPGLWATIVQNRGGIIKEGCPDTGGTWPFAWKNCPVYGDWNDQCMTDFHAFQKAWSDFQLSMVLSVSIEQALDSIFLVGNNKIKRMQWDYVNLDKWRYLQSYISSDVRAKRIARIYESLAFFPQQYSCAFTAQQSCSAFKSLKDVDHVCEKGQLYLPGCYQPGGSTNPRSPKLQSCTSESSTWSVINVMDYSSLDACKQEMKSFVGNDNVTMTRGDGGANVPGCPSMCVLPPGTSRSQVCWRPDPCLPGDCMKWIDDHDFSDELPVTKAPSFLEEAGSFLQAWKVTLIVSLVMATVITAAACYVFQTSRNELTTLQEIEPSERTATLLDTKADPMKPNIDQGSRAETEPLHDAA